MCGSDPEEQTPPNETVQRPLDTAPLSLRLPVALRRSSSDSTLAPAEGVWTTPSAVRAAAVDDLGGRRTGVVVRNVLLLLLLLLSPSPSPVVSFRVAWTTTDVSFPGGGSVSNPPHTTRFLYSPSLFNLPGPRRPPSPQITQPAISTSRLLPPSSRLSDRCCCQVSRPRTSSHPSLRLPPSTLTGADAHQPTRHGIAANGDWKQDRHCPTSARSTLGTQIRPGLPQICQIRWTARQRKEREGLQPGEREETNPAKEKEVSAVSVWDSLISGHYERDCLDTDQTPPYPPARRRRLIDRHRTQHTSPASTRSPSGTYHPSVHGRQKRNSTLPRSVAAPPG